MTLWTANAMCLVEGGSTATTLPTGTTLSASTTGTWITNLYEQILGRDPGATELANWVSAVQAGTYTPAQVAQIFVPSDFWTDRLVVKVTNIVPEKAPADQNQLFGDDLFVNVADAPTSFAALLYSSGRYQ